MRPTLPLKDLAIDFVLILGTVGATFVFGVFALPHVHLVP